MDFEVALKDARLALSAPPRKLTQRELRSQFYAHLFPDIQEWLKKGHTLKAAHEQLSGTGVDVCYGTFLKIYKAEKRIRSKGAKRQNYQREFK